MDPNREWTTRELADRWRIPKTTVRYALHASGAAGLCRNIGGTWLIPEEARLQAEAWREAHKRKRR